MKDRRDSTARQKASATLHRVTRHGFVVEAVTCPPAVFFDDGALIDDPKKNLTNRPWLRPANDYRINRDFFQVVLMVDNDVVALCMDKRRHLCPLVYVESVHCLSSV